MILLKCNCIIIFFFNDSATTEIYTLSLHDALPIFRPCSFLALLVDPLAFGLGGIHWVRSEEHTSELQSHSDLVCRLLLEKKKVLMLPLLVWLTPDLRIKKSLLKCNWTIRKRLPRCK